MTKNFFIILIAASTLYGRIAFYQPCKDVGSYTLMRSLFSQHYFYESAVIGETILWEFPDFLKNDWVTFFTAISAYKIGFKDEALLRLKTVIQRYPDSPASQYSALLLLLLNSQSYPEEYRLLKNNEQRFALHLIEKRTFSSHDISSISGVAAKKFLRGKIESERCSFLRDELLSGKTIEVQDSDFPYLMPLISRGLNKEIGRNEFRAGLIAEVLITIYIPDSESTEISTPTYGEIEEYCHLYKDQSKITKEIQILYKMIQ